jgi:hypothetical protein
MKTISTLFVSLLIAGTLLAQDIKNYTISSNKTWTSAIPTNCINCSIEIANGAVLTMDADVTLQNATITGGTLTMTDKTMTLHTSGSRQTYFTATKFVVKGASIIKGSAPIIMTNSTFTFFGTSKFNPQQLFDLTNSKLYFYDNSYFLTTGGPVNLRSNSMLVAGDGGLASKAYIYFNGPVLNVYDNSTVLLAGNNNYYFNWGSFYSAPKNAWYYTPNNNLNCGAGNANGCEPPKLYGPSTLNGNGFSRISVLPIKLSDFSAALLINHTVSLTWVTQQELNASRFVIERSTDGLKWETAGIVKATGNTSNTIKYSFVDMNPTDGANYYRLKLVDLDESFEYSIIKTVQHTASKNINVYPNPVQSFVYVSVPVSNTATTVRLLNTTGQVLQERTTNGNTVSIPVQQYTAGTYFIQVVKADGFKQNSAILIKK